MVQKKKHKEEFVDETVEEVELPPDPAQPVVHEHVCVMCRYLAQGDLGPTCVNPASPFNGQRMREEDGCDAYAPKP